MACHCLLRKLVLVGRNPHPSGVHHCTGKAGNRTRQARNTFREKVFEAPHGTRIPREAVQTDRQTPHKEPPGSASVTGRLPPHRLPISPDTLPGSPGANPAAPGTLSFLALGNNSTGRPASTSAKGDSNQKKQKTHLRKEMLFYYKTPELKAQRMRISPPGIDHMTGSGWGKFSSLGI